MSRTRLFSDLLRNLGIARTCEANRVSSREGLERAAEIEHARRRSRRDLLIGAGALTATATFGRVLGACASRDPSEPVGSRKLLLQNGGPRVAIVGGGIAGLVCADRLQKQGILATIYEANPDRVGGRCHSNRDFAGHVGENGGEMIDNGGKVMLAYAQEFGLAVEDYNKEPGEEAYFWSGSRYTNADVVDQWRVAVTRAQNDLKTLSGAPSALAHTAADVALDNVDLQTWLDTRCGDLPLLRSVLSAAYISEYGRDPSEQSCLNLLTFIHMDRRGSFYPYGCSDERYHIVGGNDQVPNLIRNRLQGPVVMGATLKSLMKNGAGEYELWFKESNTPAVADVVVLAIPFSVLRRVTLDPSLGLPAEKVRAINELGYGYNAKTELLFEGRPWAQYGNNGGIYADLPNLQNTWETNWKGGDGTTTILTDYVGGTLGYRTQTLQNPGAPPSSYCGNCHGSGASFQPPRLTVVDQQAEAFLADLEKVFPGVSSKVVRGGDGAPVLRRSHWLPQSYSRGSYTCYLPGQFTTIAGWEGAAVGDLLFAGEHADSFYDWQGFLEGAARSGIAAANTITANHAGGNK
jgi:monoamine oxidase